MTRFNPSLILACLVALTAANQLHAQLSITDVGRYDFTDTSGSGARELSGLVYADGSAYYAIGDQDAMLHAFTINFNTSDGTIDSASINPTPIVLAGGSAGDREGIALQGADVLFANEFGPQIEAYSASTGSLNGTPITASTPGFNAYANIRPNLAWESLTNFPVNPHTFLTANENTLSVDGPVSTDSTGAYVRIQAASINAADSTAAAIGQYAYYVDPYNGDIPFSSGEQSGLVDLVALPNNRVLALERALGATGYRIRIYLIDGLGATDVTGISSLGTATPGVDFTPLTKTLLWEQTFSIASNSNFEGITYNPIEQKLILIADNASGPVLPVIGQQWTADFQSLYALQLNFGDAGPGCGGAEGCLKGDFNNDGYIGLEDLQSILDHWNESGFPGNAGDLNADGYVGLDDLQIILDTWNEGTPPAVAAHIPEPAPVIMLGFIWALLQLRPTHATTP